MRKELKIGLLIFALTLLLNQFVDLPEFLMGGLHAFAICFELIGVLPDKAYQKTKWRKSTILLRK